MNLCICCSLGIITTLSYFFVASDSAILDYAIMDNVGPVQPLIKRTVVTDRIRDA